MAPIKGMLVDLFTASDDDDARTDSEVYIGFWGTSGGREFPLSTSENDFDDFDTGSEVRYILGGEPAPTPTIAKRPDRSKPGQENDPGRIPVELASVQYVYIRKSVYDTTDDDDAYKLKFVQVLLYGLPGTSPRRFALDPGDDGLWFGHEFGEQAWLTESRTDR